jgi:hypothetical protein
VKNNHQILGAGMINSFKVDILECINSVLCACVCARARGGGGERERW